MRFIDSSEGIGANASSLKQDLTVYSSYSLLKVVGDYYRRGQPTISSFIWVLLVDKEYWCFYAYLAMQLHGIFGFPGF